jgi:hypothetical protein
LNLSAAEVDMRTASYPCNNLVEIEADSADDLDKDEMFNIPHDPDDGLVRVMKLPMVDNVHHERGAVLEIESSWEVGRRLSRLAFHGFRVRNFRFRVQGSGLRVQGLQFMVWTPALTIGSCS